MESNEVKTLVEAFRGYRELLTPIQSSLSDFADTYDMLKSDIEKLNTAFSGDVQGNLEKIYKNLSTQAAKATDLASQIDRFVSLSDKYTSGVERIMAVFQKVEERVSVVSDLESRAEEQIGKLDSMIDERKRSYNVKELQRTIENYNEGVQKISEFINKGVQDTMAENARKLDGVRSANDVLSKNIAEETRGIESLVATYGETNKLLKTVTESSDVNEAYLFDAFDRWAESRKVKIKKK